MCETPDSAGGRRGMRGSGDSLFTRTGRKRITMPKRRMIAFVVRTFTPRVSFGQRARDAARRRELHLQKKNSGRHRQEFDGWKGRRPVIRSRRSMQMNYRNVGPRREPPRSPPSRAGYEKVVKVCLEVAAIVDTMIRLALGV